MYYPWKNDKSTDPSSSQKPAFSCIIYSGKEGDIAQKYTSDELNKLRQSELAGLVLSIQDQVGTPNDSIENLSRLSVPPTRAAGDEKRNALIKSSDSSHCSTKLKATRKMPERNLMKTMPSSRLNARRKKDSAKKM